jgi:hypothetical protein
MMSEDGEIVVGVALYWLHPAMMIKDTAQRRSVIFFMEIY